MFPLFPLRLVAYPGETVNLHIFEPRYQQLINECLGDGTTFGLPTFLDDKLPGLGCEMRVTALVQRYDDGKLDIRTEGVRVFRIREMHNPAPGKLYAGARVEFWEKPEPYAPVDPALVELAQRLYRILNAPLKADPSAPQPYSFQIGHLVGLNIEDEYELLSIDTETERQAFLLAHLQHVLPVMEDMERTRQRIAMNGHFREFGALDF